MTTELEGKAGPATGVTSGIKNIVLVHGAFADGSGWSKVVPLLQEMGYHVQNPMISLADEVAFTKRMIALQDGPLLGRCRDHSVGRRSQGCWSCVRDGLRAGGWPICERCKRSVWMDGRAEADSRGQREIRYRDS
jgi:hypothetical protein